MGKIVLFQLCLPHVPTLVKTGSIIINYSRPKPIHRWMEHLEQVILGLITTLHTWFGMIMISLNINSCVIF